MKITADQIDSKSVAGKTSDGRPVVYIATKGGLHAFFCKDEEGQIMSIGAAPHRAIAKFLAGKKEKIEWDKDFDEDSDSLKKSESEFFQKLRKVMWMDRVSMGDKVPKKSDTYLVYDVSKKTIEIMRKSELEQEIAAGNIDEYSLVRDLSMTQRAQVIKEHDEFEHLFEEER